jgi:hypothetical protein
MIPGRLAVSKVAVGNESLYLQLRRQSTRDFFNAEAFEEIEVAFSLQENFALPR